jgi:hypothetical protein
MVFLNSILWHALVKRQARRAADRSTLAYVSNRLLLAVVTIISFVMLPILYSVYTREKMNSSELDAIWLSIFVAVILLRAALNFRKALIARPSSASIEPDDWRP